MVFDTNTHRRFERDKGYHDSIAHVYDRVVAEPRAFANHLLFARVQGFIPRSGVMLDLACGTGHMLIRYGKRFERATGVDQSIGMLEQAKRNLAAHGLPNIELIAANVFDFLATHGCGYHFISCVGFVHHLPVELYGELLAQIKRHLRRDGVLLLAEPVVPHRAAPPTPVHRWNAESIMRDRVGLLAAAEADPDEAPLPYQTFVGVPPTQGFRMLGTSRGWELFPRHLPEHLVDRIAIRLLDALYWRSGNVVVLALGHA